MTGNEYQQAAARTLIDRPNFPITPYENRLVAFSLALMWCAGQVCERVKKYVFHRRPLDTTALLDELAQTSDQALRSAHLLHESTGQVAAARTLDDERVMLVWNAIGLAGESGELVGDIYQHAYRREPFDRPRVAKELGDVAWYTAALATKSRLTLDDILTANIEKLKARYPDGWDSARSHGQGETPMEDRVDALKRMSPGDRFEILSALLEMPEEAFQWVVKVFIMGRVWPDGLGGFSAESRASIDKTKTAALAYLQKSESR